MRMPFSLISFSALIIVGISTPQANSSVLVTLYEASRSVVAVKAESTGIYATPTQSVIIKETGQILTQKGLRAFSQKQDGIGIILDASGIIVTNAHIIQRAQKITIMLHDGTTLSAHPLYLAAGDDIALIRADFHAPLISVRLADSDQASLRMKIYSLGGSPFLKNTLSEGMVTGFARGKTNAAKIGLIRVNLKVYHGDSGSPIFNEHGELLGMTAMGSLTGRAQTFAIPSNVIRMHWENLKARADAE